MAEEGVLGTTTDQKKWKMPLSVFFKDARLVFKMDALGLEIIRIALPAAMALAADPIASLIDTAFIGQIGPVELAAVGVSIAIFNQASRITIFPLVSITTSFVAEEDTAAKLGNEEANNNKVGENGEPKKIVPEEHVLDSLEKGSADDQVGLNSDPLHDLSNSDVADDHKKTTTELQPTNTTTTLTKQNKKNERRHIPSASTAMVLGLFLGLFQAILLVLGAKPLLNIMGVKNSSPMMKPAYKYLTLRALGSPAVLLSLAMQGIFRGFKDTKTPLYATVAGDTANIILDPILIFACHMGVSGAAVAHVISQYFMSFILLWKLMKKVDLVPPSAKALQFRRFLKNGFLLLTRVVAVTICVTLAASMAARLGSIPMAAFQICLQVWMASSLLADGLAVAGQAMLACAFAEKDYKKARAVASRVSQMGFVLGIGLAVMVGLGLQFGARIFTKDPSVLHMITIGIPFVAATQPINSLAFVLDGVNFGASDFAYTAYSMVLVSIASITSLFILSKTNGFIGIWLALTIYMGLRTFAGIGRMITGTGPWRFLR